MSQAAAIESDYLEALNPAQRDAASYGRRSGTAGVSAGPLLVIAGAGTGKTMTLAHRVAHLVVSGVPPERILLLTFTRRAAADMTRRVEAIVRKATRVQGGGRTGLLPWSGTFHSVANRLLRRYSANLGLDPGFSVLDRADSADLLDVARHELGLSKERRRFPKKDTCLAIYSRCVNAREPVEDCLRLRFPWCADWQDELRQLFRGYVEAKQSNQALDYDDLLLYWAHLVQDAELAREIGSGFDHILVDEYQDTNLLQADILRALKPDGSGLTVVGDDAQSIYSFRAAEVRNILDFPSQFVPRSAVVTLEQNYRSVQPILDTANLLMEEGGSRFRKELRATRPGGGKPAYVTVEDGDAEAEFIVESVLAAREEGTELRDQAVLFRAAHHSDRLELELVRRNIPYVKYGGLKFLEAAHVKDLLAVLKWADNPKNRVAAFRTVKLLPGVGPAVASRCFDHIALQNHSFDALGSFRPPSASVDLWSEFCRMMRDLGAAEFDAPDWQQQVGLVRRWYRPQLERIYDNADVRDADLEQLEQIAARYQTRERFLTELTLDPPSAAGDLSGDPLLDEDYLVLSTVHSAKGQEWKSVYVLNVSDGNFPNEFATGKPELIDEERRLLYVAMTRARQALTLVAPLRYHVTQQHRDGDRHVHGARSRFVSDALLGTMERRFHGRNGEYGGGLATRNTRRLDVQQKIRDMW